MVTEVSRSGSPLDHQKLYISENRIISVPRCSNANLLPQQLHQQLGGGGPSNIYGLCPPDGPPGLKLRPPPVLSFPPVNGFRIDGFDGPANHHFVDKPTNISQDSRDMFDSASAHHAAMMSRSRSPSPMSHQQRMHHQLSIKTEMQGMQEMDRYMAQRPPQSSSPMSSGSDGNKRSGSGSSKDAYNHRKQREFIPDNKKDDSYWDRRRRNNEAAKRSREKRRFNDILLEQRVLELTRENLLLRAQLSAIRDKYGVTGEHLVSAERVLAALPSADQILSFPPKRNATVAAAAVAPGNKMSAPPNLLQINPNHNPTNNLMSPRGGPPGVSLPPLCNMIANCSPNPSPISMPPMSPHLPPIPMPLLSSHILQHTQQQNSGVPTSVIHETLSGKESPFHGGPPIQFNNGEYYARSSRSPSPPMLPQHLMRPIEHLANQGRFLSRGGPAVANEGNEDDDVDVEEGYEENEGALNLSRTRSRSLSPVPSYDDEYRNGDRRYSDSSADGNGSGDNSSLPHKLRHKSHLGDREQSVVATLLTLQSPPPLRYQVKAEQVGHQPNSPSPQFPWQDGDDSDKSGASSDSGVSVCEYPGGQKRVVSPDSPNDLSSSGGSGAASAAVAAAAAAAAAQSHGGMSSEATQSMDKDDEPAAKRACLDSTVAAVVGNHHAATATAAEVHVEMTIAAAHSPLSGGPMSISAAAHHHPQASETQLKVQLERLSSEVANLKSMLNKRQQHHHHQEQPMQHAAAADDMRRDGGGGSRRVP